MARKHNIIVNVMSPSLCKEALSLFDSRFIVNFKYKDENAEVIIAKTEIYNKAVLDDYKKLKLISRMGVGIDNIDIKECKRRNIVVKKLGSECSHSVVEYVMCQMIFALRKLRLYDSKSLTEFTKYMGRDLISSSVGIIGYGNIGSLLASYLEDKVNTLSVYDIDKNIDIPFNYQSDLECVYKSDIVTFHIPLKEGKVNNTNLITSKELNQFKSDAIIINTSRGGIINEGDLANWLTRNPNATAIIDTWSTEPNINKSGLYYLNNVIKTPHIGAYTSYTRKQMEIASVKNIIDMYE